MSTKNINQTDNFSFYHYFKTLHNSYFENPDNMKTISTPTLIIGELPENQNNFFKENKDKIKKISITDILKEDNFQLPFDDKFFKTVIISTGIIDCISQSSKIDTILKETIRVIAPYGNLLLSFYQYPQGLEKIFHKAAIIDQQNNLNSQRLLDFYTNIKNPTRLSNLLSEWTNKNFISSFFFWIKLNLFPSKILKNEIKHFKKINHNYKSTTTDDKSLPRIPVIIPYRSIPEIRDLFNKLDFSYSQLIRYNDCIITKYHKANFINTITNKPAKQTDNWMIKAVNLCKKYKNSTTNAVDSVNLCIEKGTIFGLLGPNGAGKTTTISMLAGLMRPSSGIIENALQNTEKDIRKTLGYIPQEMALYPRLTAYENMEFYGSLYSIESNELKKRIDSLLEMVGLTDRAHDFVQRYSTGMARRLNLAIGLINNPHFILLDEPTVGIDPQSRNCIYEAVLKLKEQGITILYTTHYMEEANKLCDNIAIIDNGRIIIEGNPIELVKNYGFYKIIFNSSSIYKNDFINTILALKNIFDVEIKEQNLLITLVNSKNNIESIEEISNIAKKHQIDLSLSKITEPDLESLFLDITGKSLRDSTEDSGNMERIV